MHGRLDRTRVRHVAMVALLGGVAASVGIGPISPAAAEPGDRVLLIGTGVAGNSGDEGSAAVAQIRRAAAVEVNGDTTYVADDLSHRVRVVTFRHRVGTPITAGSSTIRAYAGTGVAGFSGDNGPAVNAQLNRPRGLATDGNGNTYIADAGNARVRKVTAAGIITTIAGNGQIGYSGDGGPATSAKLSYIEGVAADAAGNIYIADAGNRVVRKVATDGTISTVAGTGAVGLTDQNIPAVNARLARPTDVDLDGEGRLYIADENARRIYEVGTDGILRRFAGNGTYGTIAWSPALATGLKNPSEVEVEPASDSVLIGTDEGVYVVNGVGRIARAAAFGADAPAPPGTDAVDAVAVRIGGDLAIGVGASVQHVERPTGAISGRVSADVEGAFLPVAGVKVDLLDPTGAPVATTTSDGNGRYRIAAATGQWNLRFTKPGFRTFDFLGSAGPSGSGVRVPLNGSVTMANAFLDVVGGTGTALSGRITTPEGGHPATVVTLRGPGGVVAATPIADGQGRFLFAGIAPGAYSLEIDPPYPFEDGFWSPVSGFWEGATTFTIGTSDIRTEVRVPRASFSVSGLVREPDDDIVTTGAVEAYDTTSGQLIAASDIDALGRYDIPFVAPAPASITLKFVPAFSDTTHLPTWLGGTPTRTPDAVVVLGEEDDSIGADIRVLLAPF